MRARQLAAIGQLQAARNHWAAALSLLPPDSAQARAVQREIEKIDAKLAPKPPTSWTKRLGPFGLLLAALAKFKSLALGGKFLFSILAFLGVYWGLYGWWFAVGLTGSVLMHEMGHYLMVRRYGFAAQLPMFIPGLGAYVKWNAPNVDPGVRAQISLAGPLFGFFSGLVAYAIFLSTHQAVWLAIAHFAGWLNLLNLIPALIFDGASAMSALGAQGRMAVLLVSAVLFFTLSEPLFLLVAIGTAYRLYKRDFPAEPKQGIGYYFIALIVANGFLSWFAQNHASFLFGR